MTRVATAPGTPVEATRRRGLTMGRKRAIMASHGLLCARDGCSEPWVEVDHILALALGGRDVDENCEGLCKACHLTKTKSDVKAIAKANRIIARRNGTRRPRIPIPTHANPWPKGRELKGRGFSKRGRKSLAASLHADFEGEK